MKVIKRLPLRRQGISGLRRYTPYITNRIFAVHTIKMSEPKMEWLRILVIESTLLRW